MRRRYTIIERLGSGGMSSVYRARREGPAGFSKEVALKVAASDIEEDDALGRQYCRWYVRTHTYSPLESHAHTIMTFSHHSFKLYIVNTE